MSEYLHGAYGEIDAEGNPQAIESQNAMVIFGTAPVHLIRGGANNVNKPIVIRNIAEARRVFGYSDDWASYSLCMAFKHFFDRKAVGPLVVVNVLDPDVHQKESEVSENKTPSEGVITLSDADKVDISSIVVGTKVLDTDYTVTTDSNTNTVIITEKTEGALGTAALTVTYNKNQATSVSKTPSNGKIMLAAAENIILDTLEIYTTGGSPTKKVEDTDYTVAYNADKKTITITSIGNRLGSDALTVSYKEIDVSAVTDSVFIGTTDGKGLNTGLYTIKNVYGATGMIPAYILAPGFSNHPDVHGAMKALSKQINGHWTAWIFADIPILDGATKIGLDTAKTWKDANGYTADNETVYFPMVEGTDGKKYYLSVLAAANFLELLIDNDDIPYHSASNTACTVIQNLYLGEDVTGRVYDDEIINEYLCKNGIASAAYVAGRWAIWGAHSAEYDQTNKDQINVAETNRMMLAYICNDFEARRPLMVDQPLSRNDIESIVAEEQARLDALVGIGALLYAKATLDAESDNRSDIINGDWLFDFEVTTTPLAKSLKAKVIWVDNGFAVYFGAEEAE